MSTISKKINMVPLTKPAAEICQIWWAASPVSEDRAQQEANILIEKPWTKTVPRDPCSESLWKNKAKKRKSSEAVWRSLRSLTPARSDQNLTLIRSRRPTTKNNKIQSSRNQLWSPKSSDKNHQGRSSHSCSAELEMQVVLERTRYFQKVLMLSSVTISSIPLSTRVASSNPRVELVSTVNQMMSKTWMLIRRVN